MTRRPLAKGTYGMRGSSVRIWVEGDLIRAEWRERGQRRTRSWPNTPDHRKSVPVWAKAFAEGRAAVPVVSGIAVGDLWGRYVDDQFPALRPRTQQLYTEYWTMWSSFAGARRRAEDMGVRTMAGLVAELRRDGYGPNTIRQVVDTVKMVYLWGQRHGYIPRSLVRDYQFKVAKEERPTRVPEYTPEEFRAIVAELPLGRGTTWRAGAVLRLCGYQGRRQNSVLHLRWEDVDVGAGVVTWRAKWDKMGKESTQPLRQPAVAVLAIVRDWHARRGLSDGQTGWVFPSGSKLNAKQPVYSAQSLWWALTEAEKRAGVVHRKRRAAHGLRRMLGRDVLGTGATVAEAMAALGDTDLSLATLYLQPREEALRAAFQKLDAEESGDETATTATTGVVSA